MPVVLTVPIWPVALGVRKRSPVPWAAASGRSVGDERGPVGLAGQEKGSRGQRAPATFRGSSWDILMSGRQIPRWLVQAVAVPSGAVGGEKRSVIPTAAGRREQ